MLKSISCMIVFLSLTITFPISLSAVSVMTIVTTNTQKGEYTLDDILQKHQKLRDSHEIKRLDFESIPDAKKRRAKISQQLNDLELRNFIGQFSPDMVQLDWPNQQVKIVLHFPTQVSRRYGGVADTNTLYLSAPVSSELARELMSFQEHIKVKIEFSLTDAGDLLISAISVSYRDNIIFSE